MRKNSSKSKKKSGQAKRPDHLYCWRTASGLYYYSIRASNDLTNALTTCRYQSRSGRNAAVIRELDKDKTLEVKRNQRPPSK